MLGLRWTALCAMAVLTFSDARAAKAQDSPDVGLLMEALELGINFEGSCSYAEATTVLEAWKYLAIEIRTNASLSTDVFNCLLNAPLVEANCATLRDPSAIIEALLQTDYRWTVECAAFAPGSDMFGRPTRTLADSHIGIEGTRMRINSAFISDPATTTVAIAATMAHELMHNRGFTHDSYPFGSREHPLTVPEQAEACIRSAGGSARSNPIPDPDYWDRSRCCEAPGTRFCDSKGCYTTAGGEACQLFYNDAGDSASYICGDNLIIGPDGQFISPLNASYPDAGMCGWRFEAYPVTPSIP